MLCGGIFVNCATKNGGDSQLLVEFRIPLGCSAHTWYFFIIGTDRQLYFQRVDSSCECAVCCSAVCYDDGHLRCTFPTGPRRLDVPTKKYIPRESAMRCRSLYGIISGSEFGNPRLTHVHAKIPEFYNGISKRRGAKKLVLFMHLLWRQE